MSVVNQLPCTLAQLDQRDRQVRIQSQIMGQVLKVSAVKNGLQLEFPYSKTLIEQLNVFISLEQTCCGFLNFTILKKDNKVNLLIDGPPEAASVIARIHNITAGGLL